MPHITENQKRQLLVQIRRRMREMGWTIRTLAAKADTPVSSTYVVVNGIIPTRRVNTLVRILYALGVAIPPWLKDLSTESGRRKRSQSPGKCVEYQIAGPRYVGLDVVLNRRSMRGIYEVPVDVRLADGTTQTLMTLEFGMPIPLAEHLVPIARVFETAEVALAATLPEHRPSNPRRKAKRSK